MSQISTKSIIVDSGTITYFRTINKSDFDVLFIHGLWENKEWFRKQYNTYSLNDFSCYLLSYYTCNSHGPFKDSFYL